MAETWPFKLPFLSLTFSKVMASRSGGRSLLGAAQSVVSPAGYWRAEATVEVTSRGARGEDRTLAYRGLYAALNGSATDVEVPCIANWRPSDRNGRMVPATNTGGLDGRSLMDHSGFVEPEPVLFRTALAAPLRATRLVLRHPQVAPIRAGHFFGIGDRLYLASHAWVLDYERPSSVEDLAYWGSQQAYFGSNVAVWTDLVEEVEVAGENLQVVQFWPPLRADAGVNTPLVVGRPVCKMHLADDGQALPYSVGNVQSVSMSFEESW